MNTAFDCQICNKLAVQPRSCQSCGLIFCLTCLEAFWNPHTIMCISCSSLDIRQLSEETQPIYDDILQKSQVSASQQQLFSGKKPYITAMEEDISINTNNDFPPCLNYSLCKQKINLIYKQQQVCSPECILFIAIQNKNDLKELRSEIVKTLNTLQKIKDSSVKNLLDKPVNLQQVVLFSQKQESTGKFSFDKGGINVTCTYQQVVLNEDVYVFRTVIGNTPFISGIFYWEITLLDLTENELKIGVTQECNDLNTGFSDNAKGWAYYTIGQLRNGSNSQGKQYGQKIKNKGTIGVFLNMNKGILAFSADNSFLGVAFQDPNLKIGPIYPAVAMLHKAGFMYQSGLVPPGIFNSLL